MQARKHAGTDRGHGLGLGENLGIRPDPHLQILAPGSLTDQDLFQRHRFRRTRLEPRKVITDKAHDFGAMAAAALESPRARSSITRSSMEMAKVTPQPSPPANQPGATARLRRVAGTFRRVEDDLVN